MKRRPICLFLAGAMLLGLTACGTAPAETPTPSPDRLADASAAPTPDLTPESPTPTPTPEPFLVQEADVPPGEYEPWQEAYADFLAEELRKDAEPERIETSDTSYTYCLYDMDEDGIPELFIKYGQYEISFHTICYTFRNGEIKELGDIDPASESLDYHYTHCSEGYGQNVPLTLPIYDYGALPRPNPAPMEENEVRAAISKVLWEGEPFFGVSGDGQYGNTGWTTFAEYRMPGGVYPYDDSYLVPLYYAFADVNGDGQEDCIVTLTDKISYMDLDGDGQAERVIMYYDQTVFSVQDGTVYAYFFPYPMDAVVLPNGDFYFSPWYKDYSEAVRFFGNQCYTLYEWSPLEGEYLDWEAFPPIS